jgi:2-keto-4-pentenoate hydratase/2-oxohepta-3-ene-1,7-dioic acid hydratase in catechol pathway
VKIVVYGPQERVGALVGDQVIDLNKADSSLPAGLEAFIIAGKPALEAAQRAIDKIGSLPAGTVLKASEAKLRAPWPHRRIACAGGNYAAHSFGMQTNRGAKDLTVEKVAAQIREAGHWGFWKIPHDVAGPGSEVPYPNRAKYLDYEGELAIVIGKTGKHIKPGDLAEYVWGVTLLNDWSDRQAGGGPSRPVSFNLQKNFDYSTSLGPCIVVGELDPLNIEVETKVNGAPRQKYNTKDMVYSFGELLEYLSEDLTFVPGDIVSGGTGAGTAQDSTKPNPDGTRPTDLFLKKGDVVEVSSAKIGSLTNKIV